MKKILTGFLFFILIIFVQALYIDYRLSEQLNRMDKNQFTLSNELKTLEMKTRVMTIKLKNTPLHERKLPTRQLPALVVSDQFFQSNSGSLVLAGSE